MSNRRILHIEQTLRIGRWLLSTVLATVASVIAYQIAASYLLQRDDGHAAATQTSPKIPETVDVDSLAGRHLFGIAAALATSAAPISLESEVQVIGITSAEPPDSGWTILMIDGAQHSYRQGDHLPDGTRLVAVQPDRVVLEKAGNRYSIPWVMQVANHNARFPTLNVGLLGGASDIDVLGDTKAQSLPATQQMMKDLRQQLLTRPRMPISKPILNKPVKSPPKP